MSTPDRTIVTFAAQEIDRQLSRDPRGIGESRTGASRIFVEEPLAVLYEIAEDDRRVLVLSVWLA